MPMWCSSADLCSKDAELRTEPHHRIIRVPPGESVVLNSAERAPYLLYIEILQSDLDFDPSKRSNKEVLKRIVVKEHERKGASRELIPFTRNSSRQYKPNDTVEAEEEVSLPGKQATPTISLEPMLSPLNDDDDEMDLVEQLYGTDQPLKSSPLDLSESIVLPAAPKNKELDMAAWASYTSSRPANTTLSDRAAEEQTGGDALSLDEYSERMRTAAIMLAQLNSNLMRDTSPAPTHTPNTPSVDSVQSNWLPGSAWFTGSTDSKSQSNTVAETQPSGMRLQVSEANAIKDRIMKEMLALEEARMGRMKEHRVSNNNMSKMGGLGADLKTLEDENIIRKELSKADPSAAVFSESWAAKKVRLT
jgi:phosphatidylinositol 4-kinase B